MKKTDSIYKKVLSDIVRKGRHSNGTLELNNYMFTIPDIADNIITNVKVNYDYMLGEMLWYALGDHSDYILRFKSTGAGRTSEDPDCFNSAYGDVMFSRHGYNQVNAVIDYLLKNPSGRRAIINISTPDETRFTRLDDMCTIALLVSVRDGKLDMTALMRSSDAYGCLPYDMAFFTEIQKYIAGAVGAEYGSYTHFAYSIHLYERDLPEVMPLVNDEDGCVEENPYKDVSVDFSEIMAKKFYIKQRLDEETQYQPGEIIRIFEEENCIKIK